MSTRLPSPPPEPTKISTMSELAPAFRIALSYVLSAMKSAGYSPTILESLRTDERQSWLYGFGRQYDDDRGIVTNAQDGRHSWHFYGLAADVVPKEGSKTEGFYDSLERTAKSFGLTSGMIWLKEDPPHVQWYCPGMHTSPSEHAFDLYTKGGRYAVWQELHAD